MAKRLKFRPLKFILCLGHHRWRSHIIHLGWCDTADQVDECQICGYTRTLFGHGNVPPQKRKSAWDRYWS